VSLLAELQRRSVFKVGVAYAVVAWALIQVADTLAPQMNLPEWAPRLVTFAALLGFPVALLLAWAFEMTPQGIKVDSGAVGNKRMYAVAALLAALAIGWFIRSAGVASTDAEARSIAVLPFVNMSGDPAHEYFSDGISEEILNGLARTPELRVAARTSSFAFKGKTEDVTRIAQELKVRMVLEGSVRKQGERVRITAQLIDAATGYHLWSQTYDRDLEDIFAIQDEIARAIGDELKVRVGGDPGGERGAVAGTSDLEAHDRYLRGLSLWQTREEGKLWSAVDEFQAAIARDPDYAQAYVGLSLVYAVMGGYTARLTDAEAYLRGRLAAEHALALDPTRAEAFTALGGLEQFNGHPAVGRALLQRAIALQPSYATAHQWLGLGLQSTGQLEEGLAALQRAHALDPRALIVANNLSVAYHALGRYEEALAACAPVLEYAPRSLVCPQNMGLSYLALGRRDEARRSFERWAELEGGGKQGEVERLFAALDGRGDRKAFAQRLAATPYKAYYDLQSGYLFTDYEIPTLLVLLGERELAIRYMVATGTEKGANFYVVMLGPLMDPIRCDPRVVAEFAAAGTHDRRAATVCRAKAGEGAR
jgi:TolB-like protein/Tfp pilus assembly protein PilF